MDIARFVSSLGEKADHAQLSVLSIGVEPASNPNSRVTLMDQLDALGQRKSSVDWQLSDSVYHTFARVAEMFAREAGASGIGRVKIFAPWPPTPPTDWWERMWPASHHIGTTRMADAAKRGVVDRDCRVFGLNNLYIAGSSVFPSAGTVNPTLTLVALALRLADHLAAMLH